MRPKKGSVGRPKGPTYTKAAKIIRKNFVAYAESEEQFERVHDLASRRKVSISHLIRSALERELAEDAAEAMPVPGQDPATATDSLKEAA